MRCAINTPEGSKMNQKTYIAFDQYQRYQTIANVISFYRQKNSNEIFSVLEIGSNEHKDLRLFLPNDKIVFTDMVLTDTMRQDSEFQQADGTNLPYADNSFDFVVAADVLEHIPEDRRKLFFSELNRVAEKCVVVCFPYANQEIADAESRINTYYKTLFGEDYRWLLEHRQNGLPDLEKLEQNLGTNYIFEKFFHGNIQLWEKLYYVQLDPCVKYEVIQYVNEINHFYNQNVYWSDINGTCYRVFYTFTKTEKEQQQLSKWIRQTWKVQSQCNEKFLETLLQIQGKIYQYAEKNMDNGDGCATVYWANEKHGYQQDKIYQYTYGDTENDVRLKFTLPEQVSSLRFDPMEMPCIVEDLHTYSDKGTLKAVPENGIEFEGKYIFLENDPRFQIIIDEKSISQLDLRARVIPLSYPEQRELLSLFIASNREWNERQLHFAQELEQQKAIYEEELEQQRNVYEAKLEQEKNVYEEEKKQDKNVFDKLCVKNQELQASLNHYTQHYNAAIGQREDLKRQLVEAQAAYNVISNAFFWKITKPLRVIVDLIKRPLRKIRFFRLINKGVRCCKENGFRYTWRKVKNKIHHRQEYSEIAKKPLFTEAELEAQRKERFSRDIKFSIVVPLFNTPEKFLHEMIQSVIDQTYQNWELCMADGSDADHADVGKICRQYVKKHSRIKYRKLEKNLGISGNTNACLKMATGEYIGLFDHDDLLHPAALHEVMHAICKQNADFIYTDENTFHEKPKDAFCPHFKPDYAPDTLRSYNYICHFTVFEKGLLDKIGGGFRSEFDGSQDYDMVLRLTEQAKKIVHIPEILYYWRAHSNSVSENISAKPYTLTTARRALAEHLERVGLKGEVLDATIPSTYRIKYEIDGEPLVSIIIPNKDQKETLETCITSILEKTTYQNYEIVIVENNSTEEETFAYYEELAKNPAIHLTVWEGPFNYSAINNYGIQQKAKGNYYLLLNNDVEILTPDWIQEMLMFAQRNDVGAVGAMLYYPDDTIQHAGVIIGIGGVGGHAHKYFPRNSYGYMSRAVIAQNYSAVTAACVMIPKRVWDQVHGLDESFEVAFNDVDLCMRIRKAGYLIVWTPYAELYHYESKSRGLEDTPEKRKRFEGEVRRFQERWKKELAAGDPYYNPNLTLDREDFSIR